MPHFSGSFLANFLGNIGLLRGLLYTAGGLVIIFSPSPGMRVDPEWPAILTTVVVPALAPIIFLVIMFDLLISRVVNKDSSHAAAPSPKVFWLGGGIALVILLRWLPYLLSLSG